MSTWRACMAALGMLGMLAAAAPALAGSLDIVAVDRNGAVMPDVVITATRMGGPPQPPGPPDSAIVSQDNMQFSPYVTVVRTGASVSFPNYDKIEHHVKSFSAAKEFEYKIYEKGTPPPVVFDKPGIVIAYCMLHGWMRAYVMVVDTPYFTKTTEIGIASLQNLPAGIYEVQAWHPQMGTVKKPLTQTVQVAAAQNQALPLSFDFVPRKPRARR